MSINFWIAGSKYVVIFGKYKFNGQLSCSGKYIKITDNSDWFSSLVHEIEEMVRVERYTRFYSNAGSKDYLFNYNHTEFSVMAEDTAGILRQIMPQLSKKKKEELFNA